MGDWSCLSKTGFAFERTEVATYELAKPLESVSRDEFMHLLRQYNPDL